MSDTQHISRKELLQILGSEEDSPQTNRIGEHLHQCSSCRNKLDSLAAQSEIWNKAPELLKSNLPLKASLSSHGLETQEFAESHERDSETPEWSWPIDSILDTPRHPEMMGRIGDYDIEREVGRGGMGIVLKAHEAELNRPLAIKVLAPHLASHGTARARFAKEARSAAGVIHPNVIAVYRVENEGKFPYIVMPYIAGPSMQKLVEDNGPLAEEEIVRMGLQISAGLTAAHVHGLVHRDIKPANILVADGGNRVMITDFGLARAEDDASLTRTGWLTGTPNYMSPEQTRGERLDQRSDLFSLGSLIYFLATGRLPFRSESPLGVLRRIQDEKPTPVRQVNRNISKTLGEIIDMLLEKDPADRFQSSAELHEVLTKQMFFLHQPDISKPPVVKKPSAKAVSNGRWYWGGIAATVVAAGFSAWMWSPFFFPQEEESQEKAVAIQVEEKATSAEADGKVLKYEIVTQSGSTTLVTGNDGQTQKEAARDAKLKKITEETLAEVEREMTELEIEAKAGNSAFVLINKDKQKASEARVAYERGMEQLTEEEYLGAVESFKESAKDDELKSVSLYNIGCGYALAGETDKALYHLELAVDEGFDGFDQYDDDEDLDSLRDDDRFQELLTDLEELEEAREELGDAMQLVDRGEYDEAIKLIQGVMEIDPKNEKAWHNMGYAIHMKGEDLDEAMKWHKKAAAGTDFAALASYNVACVYAIKELKNESFASLDVSLEKGLINHLGEGHLLNDKDLDNLRDDQRFEKFMARFKEARNKKLASLHITITKSTECDSEDCEEGDCPDSEKDDSASSSDELLLRRDAEGGSDSETEEVQRQADEDEDEEASEETEIEFQAM